MHYKYNIMHYSKHTVECSVCVSAWPTVCQSAGISEEKTLNTCTLARGSCWLFSCRQLDSKETYLANISTGCSSLPQGKSRTGASSRKFGKISFFAIKLSTREQSATFHDHRSNWEFFWRISTCTLSWSTTLRSAPESCNSSTYNIVTACTVILTSYTDHGVCTHHT